MYGWVVQLKHMRITVSPESDRKGSGKGFSPDGFSWKDKTSEASLLTPQEAQSLQACCSGIKKQRQAQDMILTCFHFAFPLLRLKHHRFYKDYNKLSPDVSLTQLHTWNVFNQIQSKGFIFP